MSSRAPKHETAPSRNPDTRLAIALAAVALLAPATGALAAESGDAGPLKAEKTEITGAKPASKHQETAAVNFVRLTNARVRKSAARFGNTPNVGPAKPGTAFESWVGPNKLLIRNFGTDNTNSTEGYSITTLAPVLPNGSQNFKKVISTEVRAGSTKLEFSRDYISNDWYVSYQTVNKKGETKRTISTGDIDIGLGIAQQGDRVTLLTADRWRAANSAAQAMVHDLQNAQAPKVYPNPLD